MSTVQDLDIQGISETLCDDLRIGLGNFSKLSTEDKQYLASTVKDVISQRAEIDEDFEGDSFEPILCYLILKKLGDVL